jgi:hypothetical protein
MKFIRCLLVALALITTQAFAKTWGLGAVIGAPTGLSANYFLQESRTIHTTLAYDLQGNDHLQLASHYTWRRKDLRLPDLTLGWFYGVGGRFALTEHDHRHNHSSDKVALGPSGTIGVFHEFQQVPLEVFLKVNLTVNLIPDTDADTDLMLGLHYNF